MKRTPLKRKTSLKPGKKTKKTGLARNKAEADKWCFAYFRGLPCIICGTTHRTVGHHLIPKSRSLRHRHSIENIVPVCPSHHTMGGDLCPHSLSSLVVARFVEWLKVHRPAQYAWIKEHERDTCHYKTADFADIAAYWRDVTTQQREYEQMMRQCGLNPFQEDDHADQDQG